MRALLLSAYDAVSHRYWADSVMQHVDGVAWTQLRLPARHFSWRIRGNPLTWLWKEHETLSQQYDVVLATSMVDLATLAGLFPSLGQARKIVYFHENQFAYPASGEQRPQVEAQMVNLYAALAADTVVFNTAYNRDSFVDGARAFLKKMPENVPAVKPLEALRKRAKVLPVPIMPLEDERQQQRNPQRILWNHRWEYDKNPEDFFAVLYELSDQGVVFELAVVGQHFRHVPPIFAEAKQRLARHIVTWGPQPQERYQTELDKAGIVVSTTWHEFQGLAIMEAAQRGVLPLVPDRLCFPELYPDVYRYDGTRRGLYDHLNRWLTTPSAQPPPLNSADWEWSAWRVAYSALLADAVVN
ncbi:tRNA-queuosine alpha-mannosyltransferase domain-containing protein [Halomonas sp. hl-4]|uniref:tRNA-queuosine alpha-mannosyltransferase domain-containing protein n=1 Tax=Halomonas sp. hl-4 TaxID=1761789 RepID=UPI000BB7D50E|nr:DUF3524 domain-containing protein [Halomonas sp. hl-4]SNY95987.1 protein of unknown function [Halomonas sp. hl-4]